MQEFADRFITFSETNVSFDASEIVTSVLLGKSLLLMEGLAGGALMDAKEYPARSVGEPRTARCFVVLMTDLWKRWCPIWLCCAAASGTPT